MWGDTIRTALSKSSLASPAQTRWGCPEVDPQEELKAASCGLGGTEALRAYKEGARKGQASWKEGQPELLG